MSGSRGRRGIADAPATGDQAQGQPPRTVPRRPVLVELASALLIVTSAVSVLLSVDVLNNLIRQGEEIGLLVVLSIALATLNLGLGLGVRFGRLWLTTINVAAVLGFLELISATPVGIFFGAIDVLIVLALVREHPWFVASAAARAEAQAAGAGTERR